VRKLTLIDDVLFSGLQYISFRSMEYCVFLYYGCQFLG